MSKPYLPYLTVSNYRRRHSTQTVERRFWARPFTHAPEHTLFVHAQKNGHSQLQILSALIGPQVQTYCSRRVRFVSCMVLDVMFDKRADFEMRQLAVKGLLLAIRSIVLRIQLHRIEVRDPEERDVRCILTQWFRFRPAKPNVGKNPELW